MTRPRGCRLLEAFSPKLSKPIRLFDRASFGQWIRLEADPAVLSLCERPTRLGINHDGRLIDFWVQRRNGEEMLLVRLLWQLPLARRLRQSASTRRQ